MAAITSFRPDKCCHLVSEKGALKMQDVKMTDVKKQDMKMQE